MEIQAENYTDQIERIKKRFYPALDEFKKFFVYYNKNPEVEEFQNNYANSKGLIQRLNSDLFLVTNNIQSSIENLSIEMQTTTENLKYEQEIYEELQKLYNNIYSTQNGSAIMIDDAKEEYNIQYYKNLELLFGIMTIIRLSFKFLLPKT